MSRTCLNDADGDGLSHVTDSEAAERRIVGESLDAHGLGWHHLDNSSISGLDELRAESVQIKNGKEGQ
jgi:hypothetical protein